MMNAEAVNHTAQDTRVPTCALCAMEGSAVSEPALQFENGNFGLYCARHHDEQMRIANAYHSRRRNRQGDPK